jgi:hypothetical protein
MTFRTVLGSFMVALVIGLIISAIILGLGWQGLIVIGVAVVLAAIMIGGLTLLLH